MGGYGRAKVREREGREASGAPARGGDGPGDGLLYGEALSDEFYLQPTLRVARQLLGKVLVHETSPELLAESSRGRSGGRSQGTARGLTQAVAQARSQVTPQVPMQVASMVRLAGRIVEVEAYRGVSDRAAHSYGGHRSRRNETMYGPGGRAYVYLIYGVHHCLNVVCRPEGVPEAVLIRAVEPLEGVETMARRRRLARGGRFLLDAGDRARLCRGPGCLCRAFGIDRRLDGTDLVRGPLRVLDGETTPVAQIGRSPRIGVGYAGTDAARPWRFFVVGNPCVSGRSR